MAQTQTIPTEAIIRHIGAQIIPINAAVEAFLSEDQQEISDIDFRRIGSEVFEDLNYIDVELGLNKGLVDSVLTKERKDSLCEECMTVNVFKNYIIERDEDGFPIGKKENEHTCLVQLIVQPRNYTESEAIEKLLEALTPF